MKKWSIMLLVALAGLVVLAGCQQPATDLSAYVKKTDCMACHTSSGTMTDTFLLAKSTYEESGHNLGIRDLSGTTVTIPESAAELAANEDSAGCSKCHTDQGFRAWMAGTRTASTLYGYQVDSTGAYSSTGSSYKVYATTAGTLPTATQTTADYSQVAYYDWQSVANYSSNVGFNQYTNVSGGTGARNTCFTCHDPHTNNNMKLRGNEAAVSMPSGMDTSTTTATAYTYNAGAGNFCVNCHQDRSTPAGRQQKLGKNVFSSGKWTLNNNFVTFSGPHHGPQGDFLLGVDSAAAVTGTSFTTNGYTAPAAFTVSPHYTGDSCVTCHVNANDGNTSATSFHGMYLTDAAGDNLSSCKSFHANSTTTPTSTTDMSIAKWSATTFSSFLWNSTTLSKVDTAYQALLTFFGNPLNFPNKATDSALQTALNGGTAGAYTVAYGAVMPSSFKADATQQQNATYTPGSSHNFRGDWTTVRSKVMTTSEAQAFWNFMLFAEDNSRGIHNPKYAAQLLYDAITLINADAVVTARAGWVAISNPWGTTRP